MYLGYLGRVASKLADLIATWNRHDLGKVKVALSLCLSLHCNDSDSYTLQ